MNIVYDHQIFSAQRYGGISRYFFEISNRIGGYDNTDVRIIAPFFVNTYLSNSRLVFGKKVSHFFGASYGRTKRMAMKANERLAPLLMRMANPEIVHETYYSFRPNYLPSAKKVLTVFDMIHERMPQFFSKKDTVSHRKKNAVQRSDHIICISENTKKDLLEYYDIDSDKVSVVYLANSLQVSNGGSRMLNEPYILYVGLRGGYKNFKRLLEAYASSESIMTNFQLVCFGGTALNSEENELIATLKIPKGRVIQLSGSDELLSNYYQYASAFVYPSLYEGFGIPPLEAMAHGCPVVCANTSSLPEVVGDAAITFDPNEVDGIVNAIEKVLFSSDLAEQLKIAGLNRANLFSWDKCASETHSIYKSLLP